jgi:hypothetical protein
VDNISEAFAAGEAGRRGLEHAPRKHRGAGVRAVLVTQTRSAIDLPRALALLSLPLLPGRRGGVAPGDRPPPPQPACGDLRARGMPARAPAAGRGAPLGGGPRALGAGAAAQRALAVLGVRGWVGRGGDASAPARAAGPHVASADVLGGVRQGQDEEDLRGEDGQGEAVTTIPARK